MIDTIEWADAYKLWKNGSLYFPSAFSAPITAEVVSIKYNQSGYFYGYDWLCNDEVQQRKQLISENPTEFIYFTKPTNRGTITTLQMLAEAEDEEECATVWIAATTFDLMRNDHFAPFADKLNLAAYKFLLERYHFLWHHAMRKLVPKIMVPYSVLNNVKCDDAAFMGLIQTNVMLIIGNYTPLLYSSIDTNNPEFKRITAEHRIHK